MPRGYLRDVFPLNLLTAIHRQRTVDGVPLFDWINADRSRGRLEHIAPTLWAWHVPAERCAALTDVMDAAGMVVRYDIDRERGREQKWGLEAICSQKQLPMIA
jgi:hypothetical protein